MAKQEARSSTTNKDHYDYIQSLKERLEVAQEEKNQKTIEFNDIKTLKDRTQLKVNFLRECAEKIVDTNRLAKIIIYTIIKNQRLVRRTACNIDLATKAIKILVVINENLALKILELKLCIEALVEAIENSNCNPDPSGDFMQKLSALQTAINEAFTTACDCINKSLEALQRSIVVAHYVGDEDCSKGFSGALYQMLKVIHINFDKGSMVKFPREKNEKDFYDKVRRALNHAEEELENLVRELDKVEEEKILIYAECSAIENSKMAAESAGNC